MKKDKKYYEEIRKAVGKGTFTILLGTSTRSLKRNLDLPLIAFSLQKH